MKKYQEEYLDLLASVDENRSPIAGTSDPDEFVASIHRSNELAREASVRGTQLLREGLLPVLDGIMSAPDEEIESLSEFAGKLMSGVEQKDVGLHYRIHSALMSRARRLRRRDELIRELYYVGMSLFNLETMLSPNKLRLYTARMRMCFAEAASYFETEYDDITDPETRGFIHRSMGNIALSYEDSDPASAKEKLAVTTRSIRILSDPDIRAKTPSLPWDVYLYKSHQERTTLLGFLRSGSATPEAFAQVLESAQIVQDRQLKAATDRGESPQPRWQYAYMAARFHCGAMLLPDFLDGLYDLSLACGADDYGIQSTFTHLSAPAFYMEYLKKYQRSDNDAPKKEERIQAMTQRMRSWIVNAPSNENNEQLMFNMRQFLYAYRETPGGMPFDDLLFDMFAARHPASYARMYIMGCISGQLAEWAVEDCPEELTGLLGCKSAFEVMRRKDEIVAFISRAGKLHNTGMIHFINLDTSASRELFEEEAALIRLHTRCGSQLLKGHTSTEAFADVALGHHRRYDERGGYPDDFSPSESPVRAAIYIVAAADTLAASADETFSRFSPVITFADACRRIEAGSGRRYAPFVSALLRQNGRRERLEKMMIGWEREAFLDIYARRESMAQ